MNKRIIVVISFFLGISVIFSSCEKKESENETKISHYNTNESHNNGQNCMSCHTSGGEGEGWFTIAGSVYDTSKVNPYSNATIKLYTKANGEGTLKKSIEVDVLGNFYTTENPDFGDGLFPSVTGKNGDSQFMSFAITTGECYSCHGNTTDRIWSK